MKPTLILVFPSRLGWMAIVTAGKTLQRLTFGHPTAAAAKAAITKLWGGNCTDIHVIRPKRGLKTGRLSRQDPSADGVNAIVGRLQAYAAGRPDDFRDIRLDPGPVRAFQQRVLAECRRIPYGSTATYAELAAKAGSPGAARAVGNCMAGNPIPLVIPCHRVVCSDGQVGSYSAPGGSKTKIRLLWLESNR